MKLKKVLISIIIIMLIFLFFVTPVHASIFSDDEDEKSDIEKTIDKDDRRII